MIHGVEVHPLKRFPDERGSVSHMLRADDEWFEQFGEIYFSTVYPGAIKAWHRHREMTLNYSVIVGMLKIVIYDDRGDSPTKGELQELFVGDLNYQLVKIPPMVWNGVKVIGGEKVIFANCATMTHTDGEMDRMDPFDASIPYDWEMKHS